MTKSLCAACRAVFASVSAFDKHRAGDFERSRQTPSGKRSRQREAQQRHGAPTRRCLSAPEMRARGMAQNARGWWLADGRAFPLEVFAPISQPITTPSDEKGAA